MDNKIKSICGGFHKIEMYHQKIYERAKDSGSMNDPAMLQDVITDILNYVDTMKNISEDMRDCGQRMEDRLREYKNGIEALGFIRKTLDKQ